MENKDKKKAEQLENLKQDLIFHTKACSDNARYGIYTIMATAVALLIERDKFTFLVAGNNALDAADSIRYMLVIILLGGFIYLFMESLRYYITAMKTRTLIIKLEQEQESPNVNDVIEQEMQAFSDLSYRLWNVQLIIGLLLSLLMGCFLLHYYVLNN